MIVHDNFKGALLMTLAMASFTINDTMVKIVTPDMNTGQIMFIRGILTSALIFVVAARMGALRPLKTLLDPYLALRTAGELTSSIAYIYALSVIPLPNAAAIMQAMPLAVTMGAALFLNELVGWRRWAAILVGFVGVLIIIRPGAEGFTAGSLLVIGSVLSSASRDIATKKIDPRMPALFISTVTAIAVALFGVLLIEPFGGWRPIPMLDVGLLAIGSIALFAGYQTLVMAMRAGEISFIAPFRYTSLLWAIVLAGILLSEFPDRWMLAGSAIVIAAGLYSFYRENRRHRALVASVTTGGP